MEYIIAAFVGLFTGYFGFLLGRRQDNLMLKKNIYLEYIATHDKHFRVDDALFRKAKFISDEKLSNLLDWHKLLSDYGNYLNTKIGIDFHDEETENLKVISRRVNFALREIERETKVQMLEDIRIFSYKFGGSTYKFVAKNVKEIRDLMEENNFV